MNCEECKSLNVEVVNEIEHKPYNKNMCYNL